MSCSLPLPWILGSLFHTQVYGGDGDAIERLFCSDVSVCSSFGHGRFGLTEPANEGEQERWGRGRASLN